MLLKNPRSLLHIAVLLDNVALQGMDLKFGSVVGESTSRHKITPKENKLSFFSQN